jgi:hypothetical protein
VQGIVATVSKLFVSFDAQTEDGLAYSSAAGMNRF